MQDSPTTILSTRLLNEALIHHAASANIKVEQYAFITIEKISSEDTRIRVSNIISKKEATVVFTSSNAVEAVAELANQSPEWKIFCIGGATREIIKEKFPASTIIAVADDGSSLADLIIASGKNAEIKFFAGEQRRDELPAKLTDHHIKWEEIVLYRTILQQRKVDKEYDGILFFSPTAVESFFSNNSTQPKTTFFAIGQTTERAIKQYSNNKVITSTFPSKEQLLETVIQYFHTI